MRRTASFDRTEVWWEIDGPDEALPQPLDRHDLAATALIFKAMGTGRDLHVDGPVSRSLLAGLEELVASWTLWRPDLYRPVRISATIELPDDRSGGRLPDHAVVAFSGGVDSAFTTWRHVSKRASRSNRTLGAALFVHGLDIPLTHEQQFEDAFSCAAQTLASIDVPLVRMRTNWRHVASRVWQMEFGAGLSSCLRNWQGTFGAALIGADEDYANMVIPWGSNPITFSMLSSPDFPIVLDGAAFGRTEKVQGIGDWPECLANLRVCWQNASARANCGQCEKCIRTKLNFMALGQEPPASLPGRPSTAQILTMRTKNSVQVSYLREIVRTAKGRNTGGRWYRAVQFAIMWNYLLNWAPRMKRVIFPRRRLPPRPENSAIGTMSPLRARSG
ncbi:hypothetical protein M0208_04100 [Sphingomonas sp. SUN019]|uniref:hypothetical protein n=1 Tax=Sphingomonas sp. SUN019 TaxID=2937788 RepID=UPI00216421A6|nr:hypothetical protein [Sphingomonas sp. SUN019]UVO49734.1 hypothetical protein M0208_04100 [Sphingomonas sp. SUN019]